MSGDGISEVFVFPLRGLVFFPSTSLPLNIFEPRYLAMVRDSIELSVPIAVSPVDPVEHAAGERHPADLVVGAGNPIILEERDDGTLLIVLRGVARVRLGEILREKPYIQATAEVVTVDRSLSADASLRLSRIHKRLESWMLANIANAEWRDKFLADEKDPLAIIEHAALYLVEDAEIRQLVQELDDLESRVKLLDSRILGGYATGSTEIN